MIWKGHKSSVDKLIRKLKTKTQTKAKTSTKKKANNKCPEGHKFGKDCEKFDECDDCDLWEKCIDESD